MLQSVFLILQATKRQSFVMLKMIYLYASFQKLPCMRRLMLFLYLTMVHFLPLTGISAELNGLRVSLPGVIVSDVKQPVKIFLKVSDSSSKELSSEQSVWINGVEHQLTFRANEAEFKYLFRGKEELVIQAAGHSWSQVVHPIPLWMSVLPPLIAIFLALLLREVFTALFVGILTGTTIIYYYKGSGLLMALGKGFLAIMDTYVMESLLDRGHMSIIVFSMVIGGMVHLISANGGMRGVVNRLSGVARSARSGQFATWLLGVVIFFDDYANTLVVGNTMRPVADRLRISRQKLAYIVDSTAAPVASIAFVTTWIGAELSYIQDGLNVIGLDMSAYTVFFNSLAYSFYPILTIIFLLMLVFMQRDYGPMLKAENKARTSPMKTEQSTSPTETEGKADEKLPPARAINAIIPVAVIIFGTVAGLVYTGWDAIIWNDSSLSLASRLSEIIGKSDSYAALLWSSISALIVAFLLTLVQKLLSLQKAVDSMVEGFRTMLTAILILTLAWSVALITQHMHTADFIAESLLKLSFSPYLIPAFTFVLAALVAFSTGTSWGTMAILYPLLLPTSWMLTHKGGLDHDQALTIFYSVVSAVLSGSILGDHVSPISDTTILSSISSGCNHIEHVRTQMPYALTVGVVAVFVGTIPAAYGWPSWMLMLVSVAILFAIIRFVGKKNIPILEAEDQQ